MNESRLTTILGTSRWLLKRIQKRYGIEILKSAAL